MASDTTQLPIFLSCGTPHTAAQEDFIAAIEAHLKSHGCTPQTVGRSVQSLRQPVEAARDLIGECRGAVVIAFERTRILQAIEKPGGETPKDIRDESHPTIWNQMEAAMAYAKQVPILTFVEKGLRRQGMLSDRFEWTALETELSPRLLTTERFQQVFDEWLRLAGAGRPPAAAANFDPGELKLGVIWSQLSAKQGWSTLVVVVGLLAGLAMAAFKVGQAFPDGLKTPAPLSADRVAPVKPL